jgi:hypothetical protein
MEHAIALVHVASSQRDLCDVSSSYIIRHKRTDLTIVQLNRK